MVFPAQSPIINREAGEVAAHARGIGRKAYKARGKRNMMLYHIGAKLR